MIDMMTVRDILLDIPYVSNPCIAPKDLFRSRGYSNGLTCDLILKDRIIAIFIGIPESWMRELVAIYLIDYASLPYMPHVEPDGKICLYDLEGVLIDYNFEGLLNQCIQRALTIVEKGIYEDNTAEFIREFSSYWSYQATKRYMKFALPENHESQILKYCDPALTLQRKKKETQAQFQKRKLQAVMFASAESEYFSIWNIKSPQHNGLYFYIEPENCILPPNFREPLQSDYIEALLSEVPEKTIKETVPKTGSLNVLVFEIAEPTGEHICIGAYLNDYRLVVREKSLAIDACGKKPEITALDISRIDEAFLSQRTTYGKRERTPNILLIGCGSIGGYLVSELVKAGYKNIALVDDDILKEDNIYRHYLGIEYVGQYKAEALRIHCSKNIPKLHITTYDSKAEELIEDESINLESYDIIISATGNHNFNRWLNSWIHKNNIEIPCVYLWNEPLDVGCHLAILKKSSSGCYECLFKRDEETNELYDATAFSLRGQMITKATRGCSGSYVQYASNVSLRIVSICMEWLEKIITGRCDDNILVSVKGDAFNFIKAGYSCSEVYSNQKETELVASGYSFKQNSCCVCGDL